MIEELLERIAVALENLNATTETVLNWVVESDREETPEVYNSTIEAKEMGEEKAIIYPSVFVPPPVQTTPVAGLPTDIREALLARCKELGITVPKGTRTNTLQKWVDAGEQNYTGISEGAKPDLPSPVDNTAVPDKKLWYDHSNAATLLSEEEKTPQYSRDDVRTALIALCKKNDNNTQLCRDILKTQGAPSVSELDESRFTAIMRDIQDCGGKI